mmetsp:Transcript_1953/g.3966  ORF Transcript_1953/g.3966 Transcript_1953/m.3966 type:complete len:297 (-) Transcript_1953:332-1222(-)|eukprot:CAMPEP_0168809288 /NCGR_PEP_ID=MMETSP0726-20121227/3009_1 /TAXON_ID=265536 /ORGANISM="Amphiprora sp., Strain CCMP467" /LENGTH=296 /DNA_ID=CAMNT_0008861269 /DNA_START=110 /DNA_END=1000 /DNA_ORIENTATION=-
MGKLLDEIGPREEAFIASQKVFFVATAPLSKDHHVSVSPKAPGNSCVVLDPHKVAYADLTGSGAETAAHVLENERMTLMFCNIEAGGPKILRLFGTARLILVEDLLPSLRAKFPNEVTGSFGFRGVFVLNVTRITSSCGYSLPVMKFEKYRQTLEDYCQKQGQQGMLDYQTKHNSFSIDGIPSVALLRSDGPAVEPVYEKGYILGKVVGNDNKNSEGQPNNNDNDKDGQRTTKMVQQAMKQARTMHQKSSSLRPDDGQVRLSYTALAVLLLVVFGMGHVTGVKSYQGGWLAETKLF